MTDGDLDLLDGTWDSRFDGVVTAFAAHLGDDSELGGSLMVEIGGKPVVDIWGGWRDQARTLPWQPNTVVNVWSITKMVSAIAVLTLAEKAYLSVEDPVAAHWPEFAQNGKSDITIAQVLSHTSGVAGWEYPFSLSEMYDWDRASDHLAAQAPWWTPGEGSGYHAQCYGQIVGEIVRRTTGLSLRTYVAEHLAGPLGADFQIGLVPSDVSRVADLVSPDSRPTAPTDALVRSMMAKTFTAPRIDPATAMTSEWRAADLGAMNGHGNARSVVQLIGVLHGYRENKTNLLANDLVHVALTPRSDGIDRVLGLELRWALGCARADNRTFAYLPHDVAVWGGWGGSLAVIDRERNITAAYVMNKMQSELIGSSHAESYFRQIYSAAV